MGLSLGGSTGGSSSKTQSTSSSTSTPTYTPGQTSLQDLLTQALSNMVTSSTSGTNPQVQAIDTANADAINNTAKAGSTNLTRSLASRGLGQSGQTGQVQVQSELARQGALGENLSSGAGQQLQQNNASLADALAFAFANPGSSNTGNASASGNSSSWGVGGGFSAKV